MSYINYKSEDNSIYVCKGYSKFFENLKPEKIREDLEILKGKKEVFYGVKIKNFLSEYELDGLKAEEKFKVLLDINDIPFLYIGQGPFGIERSGVLINKTKSKRADFILNIPDMGTLLFDVKCRKKIGFKHNDQKYFSLYVSELKALHNLQELILMPVWLAFYDKDLINVEKDFSFHFLPVSKLYKFWEQMGEFLIKETKQLEEKQFNEIQLIRIPSELLTKVGHNKITFEVGYSDTDKKLLESFSIKHLGLNRKLKDSIKQFIRENHCYKSNIAKCLWEDSKDFFTQIEISSAVENLIKNKIINYVPKEKLSLVGE